MFKYRLNDKIFPGKPDIVLPKYKTVIFVNGCFWHGHENCRYFKLPGTRTEWWKEKKGKNKARDEISLEKLKVLNWNSIVIWECELKPTLSRDTLVHLIDKIIKHAELNIDFF